MYVVPDSTIILLKGCPLNKNYEHTIYFDSVAEQTAYFMGLAKRTFDKCTYQRELRGRCSLQVNTADIYDCNYMMYQNSAYNNKWFYAFIDRVEWVNNANSNVYFTIDVMQTWFFDYTLQECYVERETATTDALFSSLTQENIGFGNLICAEDGEVLTGSFAEPWYALLASETQYGTKFPENTKMYDRLCPLAGYIGSEDTISGILKTYVDNGKEDAVISVYQVPKFMGQGATENVPIMPETTAQLVVPIKANVADLNGYTPRNKKLFNYPYNVLWISNNLGQVNEYRYEDFTLDNDGNCAFMLYGTAITTPTMLLIPHNYRKVTDYFDEAVSFTGFPTVPWTGDIYAAWFAQNKNALNATMQNQIIGGVANVLNNAISGGNGFDQTMNNAALGSYLNKNSAESFATGLNSITNAGKSAQGSIIGSGISTAVSWFQTINSLEAKQADLMNVPANVHNLSQSDSINSSLDKLNFTYYQMCVRPEFARILDDYFDRYGYTTLRIKIPNRNVRPHWTYTKTLGCTISARCPSDDEEAICQIYDRGITFWRNGSEVGDYSLDNSV